MSDAVRSSDGSPSTGRVPGRRPRAGRSGSEAAREDRSAAGASDVEQVRDDTDIGWGDDAGAAAARSEDERWLRDRPPHWG